MVKYFVPEPPHGLFEKIMKRILREKRFLVIRHAIIFSTTLLASLIALVPVLKMLFSDFASSEFLNFFSLIFSDFSTVAKYWQSFTMILLETLPVASVALFLAIFLVLLQSVKSLTKDIKIIRSHYFVAN